MSGFLFALLPALVLTACGEASAPTAPAAAAAIVTEEVKSADAEVDYASKTETSTLPVELPQPGPPAELLPFTPWKSWAPRCEGYPSKMDCDDGDATLFSGLLCLAGEELGCEAVKKAQTADGKFWRSPRRAGVAASNSFSRDMSLGVLAYLLAKNDKVAAQAWLQWIDKNSVCQLPMGGDCLLRTYRFCRDDTDSRCMITPGVWSVMRRVWEKMGLPLHAEMKATGESAFVSETQNAAIGYQLHLKAVIALLYQKMQLSKSFETELANTLLQKQPENLFFRYLVEGSSEELKQSLLSLCPLEAPMEPRQWTWERDTAEKVHEQSMGWDCVFLGQLLLH